MTNDLVISFQIIKTMIFTRKVDTFQGSVLHGSNADITNVK